MLAVLDIAGFALLSRGGPVWFASAHDADAERRPPPADQRQASVGLPRHTADSAQPPLAASGAQRRNDTGLVTLC